MTALIQNVADELLLDPPYRDALGDGNWLYDPGLLIRKARPTQDTDIVLFDPRLAVSGLKYRFLKAKGLEYGEEQRDFIARLNKLAGRNAPVLDLNCGLGAHAIMRMMPTNQLAIKNPRGTQTRSKRKSTSHVAHMSAPLKGLSRLAQLNEADPLLASILTNFVVQQDRITLRPGYFRMGRIADGRPISTLIPYYGSNPTFVAAAGDGLFNASGTRIGTHSYGSDMWQWTSFANLSQQQFTVMVNGIDGIVVWDGTTTSLPAMDRTGHPDDFEGLSDVDPEGFDHVELDSTTLPPGFDQKKLDKVLAHQNRLWFANSQDLAVYYLPIQTTTGAFSMLPLNAYFKRGGTIRAHHDLDLRRRHRHDNMLVIFSTNGEAAIYQGGRSRCRGRQFQAGRASIVSTAR